MSKKMGGNKIDLKKYFSYVSISIISARGITPHNLNLSNWTNSSSASFITESVAEIEDSDSETPVEIQRPRAQDPHDPTKISNQATPSAATASPSSVPMELSLLPFLSPRHALPLSPAPASAAKRARRPASFACRCCAGASPEGTRRWFTSLLAATAAVGIGVAGGEADAVSTSRRALRSAKIPESEFTTLPNGLKYYDIKVGGGPKAVKGARVAVHYVAKWKGITFMTSRQGLGVGGGTPYGFDVGNSERGNVLRGLDLGVEGMKAGGQRLIIVPPELAYGKKGIQEIPPNATIELDVELLSVKQNAYGTPVKIIEG